MKTVDEIQEARVAEFDFHFGLCLYVPNKDNFIKALVYESLHVDTSIQILSRTEKWLKVKLTGESIKKYNHLSFLINNFSNHDR